MRYPFSKHFLICTGSHCDDKELGEERGDNIRGTLKELNKKLGRKRTVRVCAVSCLDLCDDGPNMLVYPEGKVFSHLTRKEAVKIYSEEMGDDREEN